MPTLKQERLAEAMLDPTVKSKTAAMIKAGYSPTSAGTNVSRQTRLEGTVSVLTRLKYDAADKARSVRQIGLSKMAKRITDDNLPDPSLAAFTKVAADIEEKGLDSQESSITNDDQQEYRTYLARVADVFYRRGLLHSRLRLNTPIPHI